VLDHLRLGHAVGAWPIGHLRTAVPEVLDSSAISVGSEDQLATELQNGSISGPTNWWYGPISKRLIKAGPSHMHIIKPSHTYENQVVLSHVIRNPFDPSLHRCTPPFNMLKWLQHNLSWLMVTAGGEDYNRISESGDVIPTWCHPNTPLRAWPDCPCIALCVCFDCVRQWLIVASLNSQSPPPLVCLVSEWEEYYRRALMISPWSTVSSWLLQPEGYWWWPRWADAFI
jgi:hypothetical protein